VSMPRLDWSNVDKAIARGDVIAPEVWAGLDRVIAGMPFLAPKQPLPAINAPELKMGGENRASSQLDVAASILTASVDEIGHDAPIAPDDAPLAMAEVVNAQPEAKTSVIAYGVGDAAMVGESDVRDYHKPSTSKHGRKRTPKAVQIVLDYLMTHPADARLSTNVLTDKLKCDVRIKVGRSSVGKALGIVRANGQR
jgi:hypothetical protein